MKYYTIQDFSNLMLETDWRRADFRALLEPFLPILRYQHEVILEAEEFRDMRVGHESYGYLNDEYIRERLLSIADRWNCAFRIRWIIDIFDKRR